MTKKRSLDNKTYLLFLFVFSILIIVPFFLAHQLGVHSDWSFHSARVQQIYLNLRRGQLFTFLGTDTFSKIGNSNFLFYPSVFLYPWAILKFAFKPVEAFLLYSWLLMFATMLISYFCMLAYRRDRLSAFFFAIIYTIVPYHFYLTLGNYVLGEAQAYAFIPIVLLGMYRVLNGKGWKTLGIGITLEMYCHLVDTFISIEICGILFLAWLLFSKSLNWQILLDICKSVVLYLLLSAWLIVPLVTDYFHQGLTKPLPGFMLTTSLGDYIVGSINNLPLNSGGLGLLLVVVLLFGWKWCRKDTQDIYVYIVGILLTVMITSTFPWQWFKSTPLAVIQFPYRYTSFAACFLAIIGAFGLSSLVASVSRKKVTGLLVVFGLLMICAGETYTLVARNHNADGSVEVLNSIRKGKYRTLRDPKDTPIIITDKTYNDQFSYGALYGETDYLPQRSNANVNTVLNRYAYLSGKKINYQQTSKPNQIIYHFKARQSGNVDLPALVYNHSTLLVDGKKDAVTASARGTVFAHVNKGRHQVIVSYKPSACYYGAIIISVVGWFVLVFRQIRK